METFRRCILHHINNKTDTHLLTSRRCLFWIKMTRIYWKRGNSIWHSVWRFILEIQPGGVSCIVDDYKHENIVFKAIFQIYCSQWMLTVQPNYCGTCNTAKSCTDYSTNIWNIQSKNINHYHETLLTLPLKAVQYTTFFIRCSFICL